MLQIETPHDLILLLISTLTLNPSHNLIPEPFEILTIIFFIMIEHDLI